MTKQGFAQVWSDMIGAGWRGGKDAKMATYAKELVDFDNYVIEQAIKTLKKSERIYFPTTGELYQACLNEKGRSRKGSVQLKMADENCIICDGTSWKDAGRDEFGNKQVRKCDCTRV